MFRSGNLASWSFSYLGYMLSAAWDVNLWSQLEEVHGAAADNGDSHIQPHLLQKFGDVYSSCM